MFSSILFFLFLLMPPGSVSGPFWSPNKNPKPKTGLKLDHFQTTFLYRSTSGGLWPQNAANCNTESTFLFQYMNEKTLKILQHGHQIGATNHQKRCQKSNQNRTRETQTLHDFLTPHRPPRPPKMEPTNR